ADTHEWAIRVELLCGIEASLGGEAPAGPARGFAVASREDAARHRNQVGRKRDGDFRSDQLRQRAVHLGHMGMLEQAIRADVLVDLGKPKGATTTPACAA